MPIKPSLSFALLLVAAAAAGCVSPVVTTPTPTPGASASASTAPSASPTVAASPTATPAATPTASAAATPAATGTPTPRPSPSQLDWLGKTTIVSGNVYDDEGKDLSDATVTIQSLDANVPYRATTASGYSGDDGTFVVNNVPEYANIEIIISKPGWTTRRQTGNFHTQANIKNLVDFGGTSLPGAQLQALSKFPEVVTAEGTATGTYAITFSEPFDTAGQVALVAAVRVFSSGVVLPTAPDTAIGTADALIADPFIRANAGSVAGTANVAPIGYVYTPLTEARFDTAGQVLTIKPNSPLPAGDYAVGFAQVNGPVPKDPTGNAFGTDRAGSRAGLAGTPDTLLRNVFKALDDATTGADLDHDGKVGAEELWAATHRTVATWHVAPAADAGATGTN